MAARPQRKRGDTQLSLFSKEGLGVLKRCDAFSSVDPYSVYHGVGDSEGDSHEQVHLEQSVVSVPSTDEARCTACGVTFENRQEQVSHYRLDWHRYNLKRKLTGLSCIGEDDFEALSENISSLSGSDSSDEEDKRFSTIQEDLSSLPTQKAKGTTRTQNNVHLLQLRSANNHVYGMYPHVLYHPKNTPESESEVKLLLEKLAHSGNNTVWIILMKSGGHFAGGVFKGVSCIVHKTFHRYTVRAKRGTSQSTRDSKHGGHQPKSAGASLRRFNEAALEQDIGKLLEEWSRFFAEARTIFIRVPAHGRTSFFTGPLDKDDPRIRGIPLITKRPTLNEVKRVHQILSTIYDFGVVEVTTETNSKTKAIEKTDNKTMETAKVPQTSGLSNIANTINPTAQSGECVVKDVPVMSERNKEAVRSKGVSHLKDKGNRLPSQHRQQQQPTGVIRELMHVITSSKVGEDSEERRLGEMEDLLKKHGISSVQDDTQDDDNTARDSTSLRNDMDRSGECSTKYMEEEKTTGKSSLDERFYSSGSNNELTTLLHVSSLYGQADVVWLLMEHGADPGVRDGGGKTPYAVAGNKPTRDTFRKFMAVYPDLYDYSTSQIPSPLTAEMEASRKEKQAERNRIKKKQKKLKDKASKEIKEEKKVEEVKKANEQNLSDREKRALAAERRILKLNPEATSILSSAGSCDCCKGPLAGMVPFTRLDYKYCSMDCVKRHKASLLTQKPT